MALHPARGAGAQAAPDRLARGALPIVDQTQRSDSRDCAGSAGPSGPGPAPVDNLASPLQPLIREAAVARKLTLNFLKTEAAAGAILALAALSAVIVANSPWAADYFAFLSGEHTLQVGSLVLTESVSEWIKEGLMTIFFFVVGLEIKYEIVRGELSEPRKLV